MDERRQRDERGAWLVFVIPSAFFVTAAAVVVELGALCPPQVYNCPSGNQNCTVPAIVVSCYALPLVFFLIVLGVISLIGALLFYRSRRYIPLE